MVVGDCTITTTGAAVYVLHVQCYIMSIGQCGKIHFKFMICRQKMHENDPKKYRGNVIIDRKLILIGRQITSHYGLFSGWR